MKLIQFLKHFRKKKLETDLESGASKRGTVLPEKKTEQNPKMVRNQAQSQTSNLTPEPVMLIDYFAERVATVGGDGYSETVLYRYPDGSCEVDFFSRWEGDKQEHQEAHAVDPAVVEAAYAIIRENRVDTWNALKGEPGLEGAYYALKYRTDGGGCVRVTSDHIPKNGLAAMRAVEGCLRSYVNRGDSSAEGKEVRSASADACPLAPPQP